MKRLSFLFTAGALLGTATLASAQTVRVIYSEIAGDPTALVPAGADVPAGTAFDGFDRPYRSPDGRRWIISASSDLTTSEDEIIIVGAGLAGDTVVREGTAFGSPMVGLNTGVIDRNLSIENLGNYAFATNTDGPTTSDEFIVLFNGITWVPAAQEGLPVPGMPTEFFGTTLDSANILDDGLTAAYRAPSTTGTLGSGEDDFLIRGLGIVAQSGVSVPADQAGGAVETWDVFDSQDFYVSADGATYIAQGDLTGATTGDDVAVVRDAVVVQEDSPLAGTSLVSPVETISEVAMDPGGSWFVRGDNDSQQDWVYRDGRVVALGGASIVTGSSEVYSDALFSASFFWMGGDDQGNYIVGGTTSNPDAEADAVLVRNGNTVILRQGDPVDLDGNGAYDDDVFVDIFNNDDGFLTDAGILYFTADLVDGAGLDLGSAYMALDTNAYLPCPGDLAPVPADGAVTFADLLVVLGGWGPCPAPCETSCPGDANGDCFVDFQDVLVVLGAWGACP